METLTSVDYYDGRNGNVVTKSTLGDAGMRLVASIEDDPYTTILSITEGWPELRAGFYVPPHIAHLLLARITPNIVAVDEAVQAGDVAYTESDTIIRQGVPEPDVMVVKNNDREGADQPYNWL